MSERYSQKFWTWWADRDPLYAICSDPELKRRKWNIDEFFQTGEVEINRILNHLNHLQCNPSFAGRALDFGCGVDRLTRAISRRFASTLGVDISHGMIAKARQYNAGFSNLSFATTSLDDLQTLKKHEFSFIYSSLVFQHIDPRLSAIYIRNLVSLLSLGGIFVFQLAEKYKRPKKLTLARIPNEIKQVLMPANPINDFFSCIGVKGFILNHSVDMHGIDQQTVERNVTSAGGIIIDKQITNSTQPGFKGNLIFYPTEPEEGWIGLQYCVIKK